MMYILATYQSTISVLGTFFYKWNSIHFISGHRYTIIETNQSGSFARRREGFARLFSTIPPAMSNEKIISGVHNADTFGTGSRGRSRRRRDTLTDMSSSSTGSSSGPQNIAKVLYKMAVDSPVYIYTLHIWRCLIKNLWCSDQRPWMLP